MFGACTDSASTGRRTLRFTGIAQPWLRDLSKRWVRWRLPTRLGLEAGGGRAAAAITRFARFLTEIGIEQITEIDQVSRRHVLLQVPDRPQQGTMGHEVETQSLDRTPACTVSGNEMGHDDVRRWRAWLRQARGIKRGANCSHQVPLEPSPSEPKPAKSLVAALVPVERVPSNL